MYKPARLFTVKLYVLLPPLEIASSTLSELPASIVNPLKCKLVVSFTLLVSDILTGLPF